jgi:hypothetical protein
VERTSSKNAPQPNPEVTVDKVAQIKPKTSTATNESGTVSKSNPGETKVPPTADLSSAGTLPQSTPVISNENKSSNSSTTGGAPNESGTVGKSNPGETKIPPTGNPIGAMSLPPLTAILSNENKSSPATTAKAADRVNNPGKIEEAQDRDKLSLDRPNSSTSAQKVVPSTTSANSIQKIAPLDVNLIITNDLLVKKDELGDLNIYSADTLGITNSSGISSNSFSPGKAGNLSVISDRMLLKNAIMPTSLTGSKGGNTQASNLDRLLIKNVGDVAINSGKISGNKENIALADTSNHISVACGVSIGEHKFTLTGQSGLLANPKDPLTSDVIWQQDSLGINISPSHWLCDNPAP